MNASDYAFPAPSPLDFTLVVHQRAALHLLLGVMTSGDKVQIQRAYEAVTAFVQRTNPHYTPLNLGETSTLLALFEAMPGAQARPATKERRR